MSNNRQYWLLKTEPESYSWNNLLQEGETLWDGVRNHQARKYLLEMKPGDFCLIYHTGKEKAIVGVAEVTTSAQPDPTDSQSPNYWVAIRIKPLFSLSRPIPLKQIKNDPQCQHLLLVKQPRLSVMPIDEDTYNYLFKKYL